jgi:S-formylglutathione hydrolase FrmB
MDLPMKQIAWPSLLLVAALASPASAQLLPRPYAIDRLNGQLKGQVLDFTNNHGEDRRFYSPALCQKRDVYVYLPPGYDPNKQYPMGFFLHGFFSDEQSFVQELAKPIDEAIACGKLPPMIVVAPDGSVKGRAFLSNYGTFYLNSNLGKFEDYLVCDIYPWVMKTFSVRPEPEAHFILGVSMGGQAAFALPMKHPDKFRVCIGIMPPLNMLYASCRDRYMDNFDPCCWKQRTELGSPWSIVGQFYGVGIITQGHLIHPLYGKNNPETVELMRRDNPFDLLDSRDVRPGQFDFFVGYVGKDDFNLDAQAESFIYRAKQKCLPITVRCLPTRHHGRAPARLFLPDAIEWLNDKLARFCPQ